MMTSTVIGQLGVSASTHTPTNYHGSDMTGANPTKVLTHTRNLPDSCQLVIGGRVMHRSIEYTVAGNQITMVSVTIDDADNIMVMD